MFVIIQTVIAVIVVYLVFSIIVYIIVEWVAGILQLRGNTLKFAMLKLFKGTPYEDFGEKIFDHPQIDGLKNEKNKLPSYIPANNVAVALIDMVKDRAVDQSGAQIKMTGDINNDTTDKKPPGNEVFTLFKAGIKTMDSATIRLAGKSSAPTKKTFLTSLAEQTNDLESLTAEIEKWFNNYMDRVSGWYKRNVRKIVVITGIVVTIGFNVDSIFVIKVAATDPVTRERLNRLGDQLIKDSLVRNIVMQQRNDMDYYEEYVNDASFGKDTTAATAPSADQEQQEALRDSLVNANILEKEVELKKLTTLVNEWDLPVGWNIEKNQKWYWTFIGWIITAMALSAGAPFWFDMLKRFINIRNTGGKPGTAKKE